MRQDRSSSKRRLVPCVYVATDPPTSHAQSSFPQREPRLGISPIVADLTFSPATTAGSTIHIDYDYWGHPFGPMLAYLAPCPSSGCETVDLTTPIWFKIWEAGLLSGTWPDGAWAMKEVFETGKLSIPIPASVKPGKYLLKHDMVNLQTGPLQFFVNCVQLEIKGEGTKVPAESELTAFPGGYDKDEGVSWPPKGQGAEWFYSVHKNDTVSIWTALPDTSTFLIVTGISHARSSTLARIGKIVVREQSCEVESLLCGTTCLPIWVCDMPLKS